MSVLVQKYNFLKLLSVLSYENLNNRERQPVYKVDTLNLNIFYIRAIYKVPLYN